MKKSEYLKKTRIKTTDTCSAPVLSVANGIPTTTSADVAGYFKKRHEHVMDSIRNLIAQLPEKTDPIFRLSEYTDSTGRRLPAYLMTRDGFTLLAMGFTGKKALAFKLAYIEAFNEMDAKLNKRYKGLTDADVVACVKKAGQIAATIQQELYETLLQSHDTTHLRYMLSLDYAGNPQVMEIKPDEFISSIIGLPNDIRGTVIPAKNDDLTRVAHACLERMANRLF